MTRHPAGAVCAWSWVSLGSWDEGLDLLLASSRPGIGRSILKLVSSHLSGICEPGLHGTPHIMTVIKVQFVYSVSVEGLLEKQGHLDIYR